MFGLAYLGVTWGLPRQSLAAASACSVAVAYAGSGVACGEGVISVAVAHVGGGVVCGGGVISVAVARGVCGALQIVSVAFIGEAFTFASSIL